MSAQPKFMARSTIADRKHPKRDSIDWKYYEDLANLETSGETVVSFSEKAKSQVVEALDMMARNAPEEAQRVTLECLKDRSKEILEVIKDLPDQAILDNPNLVADHKVLEQILANTIDSGDAGKSIAERARIFLNLLRNDPSSMTMHLPSSEAMAAYEIREAFKISGMTTKVRHTFPTAIPEGCEPISAFERFIFDMIMPEIGSDLNARKTLSRRLAEAEKAIGR